MRESVRTRALLVGALLGCALALAERPAAAQATADYAVQVTATVQAAPPRITLSWPAFAADLPAVPNASTLAFRAGQTRANNALVGLGSDGSGAFRITSSAAGPVDVVVDVNGWFE